MKEIAPGQEPTPGVDAIPAGDAATGVEDGQKDMTERHTSAQPAEEALQTPAFGAGFGFDGNVAAGFPGGMAFGGDMSQMQMMMAMQNGMAPNAFGNFPMMGM